jgi:hypothetical protein
MHATFSVVAGGHLPHFATTGAISPNRSPAVPSTRQRTTVAPIGIDTVLPQAVNRHPASVIPRSMEVPILGAGEVPPVAIP